MPANGETAVIPTPVKFPASVSTELLNEEATRYDLKPPDPKRPRLLQGVLVMKVIYIGTSLVLQGVLKLVKMPQSSKNELKFFRMMVLSFMDLMKQQKSLVLLPIP